jgi:hypothetical protein
VTWTRHAGQPWRLGQRAGNFAGSA